MKTIKLPYSTTESDFKFIQDVQKQCSSLIKIAYNRFYEGLSEKDIRSLCKQYNNLDLLGCWLKQCAIKKAQAMYKKDSKTGIKAIFGGKFNFKQRSNLKIDKETFKQRTLLPIISQGEFLQKGNRLYDFKLEDNQIIFKYNRQKHITLTLPKLRKNIKKELFMLQDRMQNKKATVSIELTTNNIYITFEEVIPEIKTNKCNQIIAGVDLNPEYIGFSISHFINSNQKVIHKEIIDFTAFVKKLSLASNDKRSKYQVNKHKHEIIEICKYIVNKCKRFHVSKFILEDLHFKQKGGYREANRKNKNKWKKNLTVQYIKKFCELNGIEVIEINPCYTSFIGNLTNDLPDMLAASLEITRRGYYKFQKGKFYPKIIDNESLGNRWKEALNWSYDSWVKLFQIIKDAKLKYRNSLDAYTFKVRRFSSNKSNTNLYSFI